MHKTAICWVIVLVMGLTVPVSAELIGYWKLDEGSEGKFLDETDYWHDGTISPWDEAVVKWTTDGYDSNALDFLSATSLTTLVEAPLPAGILDISEATCSFWMNMPSAYQAWGVVFDLLGTAADNSIEPDAAGGLGIGNAGGSGPWYWFQTTGVRLNDNQWHHVVVTYSRSANKCIAYIDGKQNASAAFNYSESITKVRIGGPRYYFNVWRRYLGRLDEVAVYNHALSAADVQRLSWYGPQWPKFAGGPEPANGATLATVSVTLRWTAGETAVQHHVYVGQNRDEVKNAAAGADQGVTTTTTSRTIRGRSARPTYWRVDEIEADGVTVHPGVVWSFTISAKFASESGSRQRGRAGGPERRAELDGRLGGPLPQRLPGHRSGEADVRGAGADRTPPMTRRSSRSAKPITGGSMSSTALLHQGRRVELQDDSRHPDHRSEPRRLLELRPGREGRRHRLVRPWPSRPDSRVSPTVSPAITSTPGHSTAWMTASRSRRSSARDLTLMAWIKAETPGAAGTTARAGSGLLWSDAAGGGDHFTMAVLGTKLAFETGPGNPNTISMPGCRHGRVDPRGGDQDGELSPGSALMSMGPSMQRAIIRATEMWARAR